MMQLPPEICVDYHCPMYSVIHRGVDHDLWLDAFRADTGMLLPKALTHEQSIAFQLDRANQRLCEELTKLDQRIRELEGELVIERAARADAEATLERWRALDAVDAAPAKRRPRRIPES